MLNKGKNLLIQKSQNKKIKTQFKPATSLIGSLSRITLSVFSKYVLGFGIPKGAAPYNINTYQSNKSYKQDYIGFSPFFLQVCK